jgi:hypothetical protein
MVNLIKRFQAWRDHRHIIKSLVRDTRRYLLALGHSPETVNSLTDYQVIITAMSIGTSTFQYQAAAMAELAAGPNLVLGRVVEVPPLGKNQLN